jgi:hypothetical protein
VCVCVHLHWQSCVQTPQMSERSPVYSVCELDGHIADYAIAVILQVAAAQSRQARKQEQLSKLQSNLAKLQLSGSDQSTLAQLQVSCAGRREVRAVQQTHLKVDLFNSLCTICPDPSVTTVFFN